MPLPDNKEGRSGRSGADRADTARAGTPFRPSPSGALFLLSLWSMNEWFVQGKEEAASESSGGGLYLKAPVP